MITATLCACTVSETNYSICEVSKVFTWPLLETGNQEDCCTINHTAITQARGVARGKSTYRHHYSRGVRCVSPNSTKNDKRCWNIRLTYDHMKKRCMLIFNMLKIYQWLTFVFNKICIKKSISSNYRRINLT